MDTTPKPTNPKETNVSSTNGKVKLLATVETTKSDKWLRLRSGKVTIQVPANELPEPLRVAGAQVPVTLG